MLQQIDEQAALRVACDPNCMVEGIRAGGLFMPGADIEATELLLNTLWRRRQASLLAGGLTILQSCPDLAEESGFAAALEAFRASPLHRRRAMMEDACFRIWLGHMARSPRLDRLSAEDRVALHALLVDGVRLLNAYHEPQGISIQRFDLDPLLMAAIPPSYSFDDIDGKKRRELSNPYSLEFAKEVVATALDRIREVWPGAHADFARYVKTVVHLPDLESRSCSAARFAGAILLSSYYDNTLLAVEESLVHECGHQILYCVMELDPMVRDGGRRTFILPWSGAKRDAYGYFHAAYIYLILGLFFERVVEAEGHNSGAKALSRLHDILAGLERALDDFVGVDFFTDFGKAFFERFAEQAVNVIDRNRHRFSNSQSSGGDHGPY